MPLSVWRGEPVRETTTHHGPDGAVTGTSVTVRESPWSEDDRALALALLAEERDTCPGCGQPLEVCRDPATAGTWTVHQEVCQSCVVAEATRDNMAEEASGRRRGVHLYTGRTPGVSRG